MSKRADIMIALQDEIAKLTDDSVYTAHFSEVYPFDKNVLDSKNTAVGNAPILMAIDTGVERLVVRSSDGYRFNLELVFRAFIVADEPKALWRKLSDAVSEVRLFLNSSADGTQFHTNVLRLMYSSTQFHRYSSDRNMADAIVSANLIYWTTASDF